VIAYTNGLDQNRFVQSGLNYDATLRNLELIGEAASHVPQFIREKHPDVPWRMMELVHYRRSNFGSRNNSGPNRHVLRYPPAGYYASARSQICFSDPKFRYRPRPSENCLL